ncbi:MAG: hypothetical protein QXL24_02140 [Candidatus Jordarchaeaceae archaeon]
MSHIIPIIKFSLYDRSVTLWVSNQNGNRLWIVSDDSTGKSIDCVGFEQASAVFERFVKELRRDFLI